MLRPGPQPRERYKYSSYFTVKFSDCHFTPLHAAESSPAGPQSRSRSPDGQSGRPAEGQRLESPSPRTARAGGGQSSTGQSSITQTAALPPGRRRNAMATAAVRFQVTASRRARGSAGRRQNGGQELTHRKRSKVKHTGRWQVKTHRRVLPARTDSGR